PQNRALLKSLDLALIPSKAKPGSMEATIDALVNATSNNVWFDDEANAPYIRLIERGFDAVPALIEHLDDDRLTRYRYPGFNNFHGYHYRISHMASDLLEGLAGEKLGEGNMRAVVGKLVSKDSARAWWAKARNVGEEANMLAHVLPKHS